MRTAQHAIRKKISIIIPCRNSGKTICRTLESIASQTYKDYEVIVVDGMSNDSTLDIVKGFATTFRCCLISEKDSGVYDAMNKGIKVATGEWIYFLGSDDSFYSNDVLARVADAIGQATSVRFLYGNVLLNKPMKNFHEDLVYAGAFDADRLLDKNICHQSIFYHRSVFRRFGNYRTRYQVFADYDLNLRCFNRVRTAYLDKIIARFNVDGASSKRQDADPFFYADFLANMALHYGYPITHPFFNGHKRELALLFRRQFRRANLKAFRILPILAFQYVKQLRPATPRARTNKTLSTQKDIK